MKLSVHLVAWNGAKYIPYLFDSLRKQTFRDWELLIWDNHSTDATVAEIRKASQNFPVPVKIFEHDANLGFATAHNRLYTVSTSPYILLLNQDMYLSATCLAELVAGIERHADAGTVTPRLMRWDFAKIGASGLEKSLSGFVDAIGLKIFRNRRIIEDFTQQSWEKVCPSLPPHEVLVFGVSGAFPLYRRDALKKIAFADGTFFDETYTAYKEDADVAYRLGAAGYTSYVLLDSFAHHDRHGAGAEKLSDWAAAINKQKQSPYVTYHSYKNHLRTLYKNECWQNFLLDFPWIMWYELKKFAYFLLFDRRVLAGLKEVWAERADLRAKRQQIRAMRRAPWQTIRTWWTTV